MRNYAPRVLLTRLYTDKRKRVRVCAQNTSNIMTDINQNTPQTL